MWWVWWNYYFTEGAWELESESLVIILQASGAHPINNTFIRRASDLQLVLHHVEGVVREVDLLDALDDLLLRLGVDWLLPQLPQLLLKEGRDRPERDRQRRGERESEDVLEVSTFQTHWDINREGPKAENYIISPVMKTTNNKSNINVKKNTSKLSERETG